MQSVALIHWNQSEIPERLERLARAGFRPQSLVTAAGLMPMRQICESPPDAIIIDLSRLPSHGREAAVALRQSKAARSIPLIFVGGAAEKVANIRSLLPDAVYSDWDALRDTVRAATRGKQRPPAMPDLSRGYSGTPLPKKLGITDGSTVLVLNAPPGFVDSLGLAQRSITFRTQARGLANVLLLFAHARSDLQRRTAAALKCLAPGGALWLAWPKKTSGVATDLDEAVIRDHGAQCRLVDTKVCAINATWSALRFSRRVKPG